MNNKELLQHLMTYYDIYRFVSCKRKTKTEVLEYLVNELDVNETTARRYVKTITSEKKGIFNIDCDTIQINKEILSNVVEKMYSDFGLSPDETNSDLVGKMVAEKKNYEQIIRQQQDNINELKMQIEKLQNDYDQVIRKYINGKMERNVVYASNVSIEPKPDKVDTIFLSGEYIKLDIKKSISKYGGERISFYNTLEAKNQENGNQLTETNYRSRLVRNIMTSQFFRNWSKEQKREKDFRDIHGMSDIKNVGCKSEPEISPIERRVYESIREKTEAIEKIINDDRLTDQMKLQLYARYSMYHGTEMEQLINYAAEQGVNAQWFIRVLDDAESTDSYEEIKNFLSVFAKASEYNAKMEFARELVDGKWYIVMDYDDKKNVPFVVVPADEIDEIKGIINDSAVRFKSPDDKYVCPKITDNYISKSNQIKKDNADELIKEEGFIMKPDFVQTYYMDDEFDDKEQYEIEEDTFVYGERTKGDDY